jgi:hypothetical protein
MSFSEGMVVVGQEVLLLLLLLPWLCTSTGQGMLHSSWCCCCLAFTHSLSLATVQQLLLRLPGFAQVCIIGH